MTEQDLIVSAEEVDNFVRDVLLDPAREQPVVGVTTRYGWTRPLVDPSELQDAIGTRAIVRAFITGDATWRLSSGLPEQLDVFGGAIRVWWPSLSPDSDPNDHPLFRIQSMPMAERAVQLIRDLLDERQGAAKPATKLSGPKPRELAVGSSSPWQRESNREIEVATVTSIEGRKIYLDVGGERGFLAYADISLDTLARSLKAGVSLRVFRTRPRQGQLLEFSSQGLMAPRQAQASAPDDPWGRIAEEYKVGDVVSARVAHLDERFILVELLPGATAIVHISELDYSYTAHPRDLFDVGDVVKVLILDLDIESKRCEGSIKRAYGNEVRPSISPLPGEGRLHAGTGPELASSGAATRELQRSERRAEELDQERQRLADDRRQLVARNRELDDQNIALRRELKSLTDRLESMSRDAERLHPLSSETNFLAAVRVAYAELFGEDDRFRYPLQKMKVGTEFLDRVQRLDGIDLEKIIKVCALVACGRAHEFPAARQVHELRTGKGGSPAQMRADGARAWRCALQVNTPSARRLHWWGIPGEDGAMIEFASVAVHDDFSIPE